MFLWPCIAYVCEHLLSAFVSIHKVCICLDSLSVCFFLALHCLFIYVSICNWLLFVSIACLCGFLLCIAYVFEHLLLDFASIQYRCAFVSMACLCVFFLTVHCLYMWALLLAFVSIQYRCAFASKACLCVFSLTVHCSCMWVFVNDFCLSQ